MIGAFNDEWASAPQWAAMYRSLGLQVVPAHTPAEGGQWKRPFGDWLEFQDALVVDPIFKRWFDPQSGEHAKRRNMGLVMGRASGDLFAIDLDVKPGSGAFDWWTRVLNAHFAGVEPETWAQRTGGGGRQLFFRAPGGWTPPTFKTLLGVDLRGQGGFVMAPPSMHASGQVYDWEPGRSPWLIEPWEAPEPLVDEIEALREAYGGAVTSPPGGMSPGGERRLQASPPADAKTAFGLDQDGREDKLTRIVWGAVVDLYREAPIPPPESEQEAEIQRVWTNYQLTTKSRLEPAPGSTETQADLLEREGRGLSALRQKWAYAMGLWETKVRAAAALPKPGPGPSVTHSPPREPGSLATPPITPETLEEPDTSAPESASGFVGDPPERLWLVPDWIVQDEVNSLYGMGGFGKTLLAQQLAYSAATGEPWLGQPVTRCNAVLAVFCEDKRDELWRRHDAIRKASGHVIGNPYGGVHLWARYGLANTLLSYRQDAPVLGAFHGQLKERIESLNPELLIIDTIRDVFGADERNAVQVNHFLKAVLGGMIRQQLERGHTLTILLLGHPSILGQKEGHGFAGSTAWENGVRSRLYLTKPETGASNERTLTRGKANYAASGEETALGVLWANGAFEAIGGAVTRRRVEANGLALVVRDKVQFMWAQGRPYNDKRGHERCLHSLMVEQLCEGTGASVGDALEAIRQAIEDGLIVLSRNTGKRGWRLPIP